MAMIPKNDNEISPSGAPETASPETKIVADLAEMVLLHLETSICDCGEPYCESDAYDAAVALVRAIKAAPPAPEPQTPAKRCNRCGSEIDVTADGICIWCSNELKERAGQTPAQPAEEMIEHHKKECNRYGNGFCGTVRCMKRGGWKPDSGLGYEVATCEAHETVLILADHQRLSTAHETLQAEHDQLRAERDKLKSALSNHLCEHDMADWIGCSFNHRDPKFCAVCQHDEPRDHQILARAEKAEAELASLRSSRETEQRKAFDAGDGIRRTGPGSSDWAFDRHMFSAAERDEAFKAYQQRQPQEDGQA